MGDKMGGGMNTMPCFTVGEPIPQRLFDYNQKLQSFNKIWINFTGY